jgi:hypothetical protein
MSFVNEILFLEWRREALSDFGRWAASVAAATFNYPTFNFRFDFLVYHFPPKHFVLIEAPQINLWH